MRQVLLIVCLLTSCRGPHNEPALMAYHQFVEAVDNGQVSVAYSMLSASSRKQLEVAYAKVSSSEGQTFIDELSWLTFASGIRPQQMKEARVVEQQPDRVVIEATVGGKVKNQQLVLEEGQWKVDWTSVLHPQT